MIKILHTGDWHIGASFSSMPENLKKSAEQLQFDAVSNIVSYANIHNINYILIAGDTFDSHVVSFEQRTKILNILSNFSGKIFIVCGNHDYYFKSSFWDNHVLPQNIHLFKQNEFEKVELDDCVIYGASFTNIYEKISCDSISICEDKLNIGIVHSDILSNSQYNPLSKSDIANTKLDYLAVGHNHSFSEFLKATNTYYCATGNISSTGFDEMSQKGFVVATITNESRTFEFVPSGGLQIFDVKIDISACSTYLEIVDKILEHSAKNVFLKVTLLGIANVLFENADVISDVSNEFFGINLLNITQTPENLWKYIEDDNLLGEYTRIMRQKYENGHDVLEILNALKLGIDALTF